MFPSINCRQLLNEVCTCPCRGTGKFHELELESYNLESLKKYEKELKDELKTVQQRLKEKQSSA